MARVPALGLGMRNSDPARGNEGNTSSSLRSTASQFTHLRRAESLLRIQTPEQATSVVDRRYSRIRNAEIATQSAEQRYLPFRECTANSVLQNTA